MRILKINLALFIFLAFGYTAAAQNPLKNTKWAGPIHGPQSTEDAVFEFKADTLIIHLMGEAMEFNTYAVSGDTIAISKYSGVSDCSSEKGIYLFKIANEKLTFTEVNDPCAMRSSAFSPEGYMLVKKEE